MSDNVTAAVQAFLDHLEHMAERPNLDHLTDVERRETESIIESLEAGRGIDPYAVRPSLEQLLGAES